MQKLCENFNLILSALQWFIRSEPLPFFWCYNPMKIGFLGKKPALRETLRLTIGKKTIETFGSLQLKWNFTACLNFSLKSSKLLLKN